MHGVQFDELPRSFLLARVRNFVANEDLPTLDQLQPLLREAPVHHDHNIAAHAHYHLHHTRSYQFHTRAKLRFVLRIEDQGVK